MTKPLAIDTTIVNDEDTYWGFLDGALGLPRGTFPAIDLHAAHPRRGALAREGRTLGLEIALRGLSGANRKAARALLYRALDAENGTLRLTGCDDVIPGIAPSGIVALFGPWDLYYDASADAWKARDLLQPDDLELTLSDGWSVSPGAGLTITGTATATCANPLSATAGTIALWWQPASASGSQGTSYLFDEGGLAGYFDTTDNRIKLTDGTNTAQSAALTFAAEDEIHLAFVWSASGLAIYVDGAADGSGSYDAPALGATLYVGSTTAGASQAKGALSDLVALDQALASSAVARLQGYGRGGLNPRWMDVVTQSMRPGAVRGQTSDRRLAVRLDSDGDALWRQRNGDYAAHTLDSASDSFTVDNDGDADAYPIFYIEPQSGKAAGQIYKRWCPAIWNAAESSGSYYPVMIGALNLTGKAQADGDDIRVFVDGEEVDRWLGGTLVSAVKVWYNGSFEPAIAMTLVEAIDADDESLTVNGDIATLPAEGILYIGSEAITYTSRNVNTGVIGGLTRAAKGTSAAGHSASAAVYWVQHDVWVYYGDASLSAPDTDDDYEPIIDLDNSTNASWVYTEFGEDGAARPLSWAYADALHGISTYGGGLDEYTANRGGDAEPWEELGIYYDGGPTGTGYHANHWYVYNPCGITGANFQSGEQNVSDAESGNDWYWDFRIRSSPDGETWTDEYTIPDPSGYGAWEAWSRNETLDAGATYVGLYARVRDSGLLETPTCNVEASSVTLALDDDPTAVNGAEQTNYPLDLVIENQETGESIALELGLSLNEVLTVDTDSKTIVHADGTRAPTALTKDAPRLTWLRLVPGENTIALADAGTVQLAVRMVWDRRLYE